MIIYDYKTDWCIIVDLQKPIQDGDFPLIFHNYVSLPSKMYFLLMDGIYGQWMIMDG